jgi:hypothetical protein
MLGLKTLSMTLKSQLIGYMTALEIVMILSLIEIIKSIKIKISFALEVLFNGMIIGYFRRTSVNTEFPKLRKDACGRTLREFRER